MPGYLAGHLLGLPSYKDKTTTLVLSAQETLYKAILVLLTVTAIIWMSVFLYATFYYSYMPAISHARPVHLQFSRSCGRNKDEGMCSFPKANVTLTKRNNLLMVGQPYKILIEMEMPESKANRELGMFLVCAKLKDKGGAWVANSCRTAMLHYKSSMFRTLATLFFSPFLLAGSAEEKQIVPVELFTNFEEDPERPITEAAIEIQSHYVEIYQTYMKIHAHFTGLRYFMFHWPVLSAFLGITTNLFFLAIIACLSWYKFFTPKQVTFPAGYDPDRARSLDERRAMAKQRLMRERGRLLNQRSIPEITDVSHVKDELVGSEDLVPIVERPGGSQRTEGILSSRALLEQQQRPSSDSDASSNKDYGTKEQRRRSSDDFVVLQNDDELNIKRETEQDDDILGKEIPIIKKVDSEKSEKDEHEEAVEEEEIDPEDKENARIKIIESQEEGDLSSTLRHRVPISKSSDC